ncbi:hypothetical protein CRM22_006467 [Opisthorchis felineus]|uniref:EF-hand domain-containing protein n=1 Tax=Opisthorchis felineus TaxID=147828 RepID=A0A4V3SEE6_OPIFE|nr:hypothetical protein CRM22_006467 [Opisthorchis felineus]
MELTDPAESYAYELLEKGLMTKELLAGDGTLDFGEFLRAMSEYYVQRPTKRGTKPEDNEFYRRAFAEFDQDGDGYICAEELRVLMASFGEPLTHDDIMEMIQEADTDGDGKVNFEEFLQVLQ